MVVLVAVVTGVWRLAWRKLDQTGATATPSSAPVRTDVGVQLTGVKAKGATVARVSAPAAGVVIDDSEFTEDLNIQDVAVGRGRRGNPPHLPP